MLRHSRSKLTRPLFLSATVVALTLAGLPAAQGAVVPSQAPPQVAAVGWAQSRFGPAHTAYNPAERALSLATVSRVGTMWSVPVSRPAFVLQSSPTVVAGVAYLPTWDAHLVAANVGDGSVRWRKSLPGGMFGAAPVDSTSIYTWLSDGTIRAYRTADGSQRWSVAEENGGGLPSSSLTQVGNVLYGASFTGEVFARDAQTGRQIWRYRLAQSFNSFFGSTVVWKGRVLAISSDDMVHSLSATTGVEQWSHRVDGITWETPPAVGAGGLAFVVDSFDGQLVALDATTGAQRWRAPLGRSAGLAFGGDVAIGPDKIFLTTSNDEVLAISAAGSVLWRRTVRGSAFAGGYHSQPVLANGLLWVTGGANLLALDALTGRPQMTLPTGSVFAEPVVVSGRVYTAEADHRLHAYGLPGSFSPKVGAPTRADARAADGSVATAGPSASVTVARRLPTDAEQLLSSRLASRHP